MILLLLTLFFTHWVGDFLLQSDTMALNKSKSLYWLFVHVFIYSGCFFISTLFFFKIEIVIYFFLITFVSHFITDFITSRITSHLYVKGDRHNFFVVIGLDQFLHTTQLLLTFYYLLIC